MNRSTNQTVALKIIYNEDGLSNEELESTQNEVNMLSSLNHDNILKILDSSTEATYTSATGESQSVCYIALEYVGGGDMFDVVAETGRFTENVARYYFQLMIDALEHMHDAGISHRDIKLDNMLLGTDFNLKIADFGFSSTRTMNATQRGTEGYMAPEILKGEEYIGTQVDIFAMGVVLFTMVTQYPPFKDAYPNDRNYKFFAAGRSDIFWNAQDKRLSRMHSDIEPLSNDFRELVESMIAPEAHKRPSLSDIKEHPWYTSSVPTESEI